jgi:hypothetical protein
MAMAKIRTKDSVTHDRELCVFINVRPGWRSLPRRLGCRVRTDPGTRRASWGQLALPEGTSTGEPLPAGRSGPWTAPL